MTRAEKIEAAALAVSTCGSLAPESPRACELMDALREALASSERDSLPVIRTCGGCPALGTTAERYGPDGERSWDEQAVRFAVERVVGDVLDAVGTIASEADINAALDSAIKRHVE